MNKDPEKRGFYLHFSFYTKVTIRFENLEFGTLTWWDKEGLKQYLTGKENNVSTRGLKVRRRGGEDGSKNL